MRALAPGARMKLELAKSEPQNLEKAKDEGWNRCALSLNKIDRTLLSVTRYSSLVTCHLSLVTCHSSLVTRYLSLGTRYLSLVIRCSTFISFFSDQTGCHLASGGRSYDGTGIPARLYKSTFRS